MTVNTQKSRPGSVVAEAFRLKALAECKEKNGPKVAPTDVHKKPAKAAPIPPDVHKKAGNVNKRAVKVNKPAQPKHQPTPKDDPVLRAAVQRTQAVVAKGKAAKKTKKARSK